MPAQPPSRRALWVGGACALAVLAIWTSFILTARSSARHALMPLDIAFLRFLFSGLAAVPLLGESLGGSALGGLVCVTAGLLLGLWAAPTRRASPATQDHCRAVHRKGLM